MIPSYVINLASATGRMARMRQVLGDIGIEFTRHEAVDAEHATRHAVAAALPPPRHRAWSPSELGCLLSHYEVWSRIAEGTAEFGAVFEDDIHVDPRLATVLAAGPGDDVDILKLETVLLPTRVSRAQRSLPGGLAGCRLRALHTGAGGYVVSKGVAATLIERVALFDKPVDHLLFEPTHPVNRSLNVWQVVPALVVQDSFLPSDLRNPGLSSSMTDRPVFDNPASTPSQLRQALDTLGVLSAVRSLRAALRSTYERSLSVPYRGPLHDGQRTVSTALHS